MDNFVTVRKGGTLLHLSYDHTFTNNLYGYDIQIREQPAFEIRLDLNPNLRTRNKETDAYLDARELADGDMERLKIVQILDDDRVMEAIARCLRRLPACPETWILTLRLEKDWSFIVTPEFRAPSLFLDVKAQAAART